MRVLPVFRPIRTLSSEASPPPASSRSRFWMASAASTARRAWSSWAAGTPTKAMKPSPRNLLTVPPKRSTSVTESSKKRLRSRCMSSEPQRSVRAVEPTMSQKRTVTGLCSPSRSGAGSAGRGSWGPGPPGATSSPVPQAPQKRASGLIIPPQAGQAAEIAAPQSLQKSPLPGFSPPHRSQRTTPRSQGGPDRDAPAKHRITPAQRPACGGSARRVGGVDRVVLQRDGAGRLRDAVGAAFDLRLDLAPGELDRGARRIPCHELGRPDAERLVHGDERAHHAAVLGEGRLVIAARGRELAGQHVGPDEGEARALAGQG